MKVEAEIYGPSSSYAGCLGFEEQEKRNRATFFRPGQIFAVLITSSLVMQNDCSFRNVDFCRLPLEPISMLKAAVAEEYLEDRGRRLAQILSLPLQRMSLYCKELYSHSNKVECLICKGHIFDKDEWAACHFRHDHWDYYFSMLPESVSSLLQEHQRARLIPTRKLAEPALGSTFSGDEWITLEDVTKDKPIKTDKSISDSINLISIRERYPEGPAMIQRFAVVREGLDECLCVGIHTYVKRHFTDIDTKLYFRYARTGCGAQPDQDLFAIIHSSKEVPSPLARCPVKWA